MKANSVTGGDQIGLREAARTGQKARLEMAWSPCPRSEMNLNDLLSAKGIAPEGVIVLRHRSPEANFNRVLPWLAAERPDLYNAHQQTQAQKLETAMLGAAYIASFIGHAPGKALFIGLYRIGASRPLTYKEFWDHPPHIELGELGNLGFTAEDAKARKTVLWFDLPLVDFYAEWKGKLVVGWPPPERSWWRRAHRNSMPVLSVLEESTLEEAMPPWEQIDLSWAELMLLSPRWRGALAQWRGIYLIFDKSDGKRYVGAAYGESNLLGRWQAYGRSGHGGNTLLRGRDPKYFRFTVLQRVSPDMSAEDVIALESTWKKRLHTGHPYGLNDN